MHLMFSWKFLCNAWYCKVLSFSQNQAVYATNIYIVVLLLEPLRAETSKWAFQQQKKVMDMVNQQQQYL